jgi:glycosyltransferase involved in cell wall biosynthesis
VPLYSIDSRSRLLKHKFERTPKISLVTNVTNLTAIPQGIRLIAPNEPQIITSYAQWSESTSCSDAALVWFAGDRLLEGSPADLLKSLHAPNRRSFVIVSTPCLDQVSFLTVQPRAFVKPALSDYWNFEIRIESAGKFATPLTLDASHPLEPWAMVVQAIAFEKNNPGFGIERLLRLWESREKLPDIITTLVLRNLVAAMLWHQESAKARKFLEAGAKLFPTYAELYYLAALLAVREHRFAEALPLLERAKSCNPGFPGSGGENTYRCDWLLGILAARVGNERLAFQHFLNGVNYFPLFESSFEELLKLRVPRSLIEFHQYDFTRASRRNPQFTQKIFDYLLVHRAFAAGRRLAEAIPLDNPLRENLETQLSTATAPFRFSTKHSIRRAHASSPVETRTFSIVFEGPFFEHSSLARINREVAHSLQSSPEFEISLTPSTSCTHPPHLLSNGKALTASIYKPLPQIDLTIRHQWPPDFRRSATGKLAVILPWEYGGVPRVWINQIQQNVDELWVPSNFVREAFVRNRVDPDRVKVIPNSYDPAIFIPDGPTLRPQGARDFVFLFVGAAIRRKGIDLLLDAYKCAFQPGESVTLVLLVSGATAYQHNSWLTEIRRAATDQAQPHVLPLFETIDDMTLANLYRGADALVLPYRGEGFGMPLLEAMACAKPVITTAEGPSKDFCDESNSYLIPARTEPVPDQPPPLGPMAGPFTWFEPNFPKLVQTLRHVYENRAEAAAKGGTAKKTTSHLTWQYAAGLYAARIRHLCRRPIE